MDCRCLRHHPESRSRRRRNPRAASPAQLKRTRIGLTCFYCLFAGNCSQRHAGARFPKCVPGGEIGNPAATRPFPTGVAVGRRAGGAGVREEEYGIGGATHGLGGRAGESLSLTIEMQMVRERLSPAQLPKPCDDSPFQAFFVSFPVRTADHRESRASSEWQYLISIAIASTLPLLR